MTVGGLNVLGLGSKWDYGANLSCGTLSTLSPLGLPLSLRRAMQAGLAEVTGAMNRVRQDRCERSALKIFPHFSPR